MPQVVTEDRDQLTKIINVTIEPTDYEPEVKKELNKYRKEGSFKGFRKGKTPMNFLKKMFGERVLIQAVNEKLSEAISEFLKEHKTLGQPIPADDHEAFSFDIKSSKPYVFRFEIGMEPEFEIQGVGKDSTIEKMKVRVSDSSLDEELENLRKRSGNYTEDTETVQAGDLVKLEATELKDGEPREDGLTASFSLSLDDATDTARDAILAAKPGDEIVLNVYDLEKDVDEEYVRKNMLGVEEVREDFDPQMRLKIVHGGRSVPAELNEEWFETNAPEGVTNEAELRDHYRTQIEGFFGKQSDALAFRAIQDHLLEANKDHMPLPTDFLKRWLVESSEGKNTMEEVEKNFEDFATNLRWSLLRNRLAEKYEIKITEEDLRAKMREQIKGYFGGQAMGNNEEFIEGMVDRMMQDPSQKMMEQHAGEILADRLGEKLEAELTIVEREVSEEEMNAEITRINEENKAAATVADEEE